MLCHFGEFGVASLVSAIHVFVLHDGLEVINDEHPATAACCVLYHLKQVPGIADVNDVTALDCVIR